MSDALDQIFAAARGDGKAATPPPALMARVLADAYAHQPVAVAAPVPPVARPSAWRGLLSAAISAVGGPRAVAGLGTVAVAGVFIGYASPPSIDWLSQGLSLSGAAEVELLSAEDLFLTEG